MKIVDRSAHPPLERQTQRELADADLDGDFPDRGRAQQQIVLRIGDGPEACLVFFPFKQHGVA
jgi:hypothetical protein